MTDTTAADALFGAYVADAATLGVHWLYDPDRIEALGDALWRTPDAADFEGAKGIFVHHGKHSGDISQYGAQMRAMVRAQSGALRAVMDGESVADALAQGVEAAGAEARDPLAAALSSDAEPIAYAGEVGRACPLPQTLPVAFRIAATAQSYAQAVEINARAGGDNCGRAVFLGALFGAGDPPPPLWVARLHYGPTLAAEIETMLRAGA